MEETINLHSSWNKYAWDKEKFGYIEGASDFQKRAIEELERAIYPKANSKEDLDYNLTIKECVKIIKELKAE